MQVDQLCQALMPTGVRNLRGMLHATAVEVLLVSEMLIARGFEGPVNIWLSCRHLAVMPIQLCPAIKRGGADLDTSCARRYCKDGNMWGYGRA